MRVQMMYEDTHSRLVTRTQMLTFLHRFLGERQTRTIQITPRGDLVVVKPHSLPLVVVELVLV